MKTLFLLCFNLLVFACSVSGQASCACCNNIIESPVVSKPTDPSILSSTCNTLVVKWKGNANQTYIVSGTYPDPSGGGLLTLQDPISITVDDNLNYAASIPVVAGSKVSWNVKALQVIDDRTFSSYTLRAMQDYPIPDCLQSDAIAEERGSVATLAGKEQLIVSNDKFAMYPNPVKDAINLKLSSEYKGNVKLTVLDISGKIVLRMDLQKQQTDYYNRISVGELKPGMYFINLHTPNGKYLTTKFLKN